MIFDVYRLSYSPQVRYGPWRRVSQALSPFSWVKELAHRPSVAQPLNILGNHWNTWNACEYLTINNNFEIIHQWKSKSFKDFQFLNQSLLRCWRRLNIQKQLWKYMPHFNQILWKKEVLAVCFYATKNLEWHCCWMHLFGWAHLPSSKFT